jgi:muramoyltetrapeptide carboxypeptidase
LKKALTKVFVLRKIQKSSTLAIIAPGFPANAEKIATGITYLESKGFKVKSGKSLQQNYGYFSAPDQQRAKEINDFFADPQVDAIFCVRGGWGSLRLLDKLDYNVILKNPKALIGYSDITTLQLAIWQKCGIPSISGPMVAVEMAGGILDFTEKFFWPQVTNREKEFTINLDETGGNFSIKSSSEGTLIGGCLTMIVHQLGTPYAPDFKNCVLFIEDIGEEPYKIDRNLAQLKQAGILNSLNGLIVGSFIDCVDERSSTFTLNEIFQHYFTDLLCPVIYAFPYGHGLKKVSLPIGVKARLNGRQNTILIDNPFF